MDASGILGHVSTDRAGNLAGRIGGVVQPIRSGCLTDCGVAYTALDHCGTTHRIYPDDPVKTSERKEHAHLMWERTA
ncbi:hypothetical protein D3C72_1527010 [compost metagenome]